MKAERGEVAMVVCKETLTYKAVGSCDIKADVYARRGDAPSPAIVWIHGGALIIGRRDNIRREQLQIYREAGYSLVSIDYRLAPETKLGGIVEDVVDAFKWVRAEGPTAFNIDPDRLAAVGHSAGGYLALVAGFRVHPSPRALVSFYGYGDITGEWYARPDPFYCKQPMVSGGEAHRSVGKEPISEASDPGRGRFYLYLRQQGLWPREVAGLDPETGRQAFDSFCPLRNVNPAYPPTMLLHGDSDTDVPCEQSLMMADRLLEAGIECRLVTVKGGGHGFDGKGLGDPAVRDAFSGVLDFLKTHV